MCRQCQYAIAGALCQQVVGDIYSRFTAKRDIQQDQIGLVLPGFGNRVRTIGCGRDNARQPGGFDNRGQSGKNGWLIVDE